MNFIISHDPRARFRFAALQSPAGKELQCTYGLDPSALDTLILIEYGRVYTRSTAALRIARRLSGAWPLLGSLILVPRPVRDFLYDQFAGNRYRWFGKREDCMTPGAELRERFLLD